MKTMKHEPERTCIGCRGGFNKQHLVRIIAGPAGPVIDYREKMPGRAAYVCPNRQCIEKALSRENLSRALRLKKLSGSVEAFIEILSSSVREKIRSLVTMSMKAGKAAAGYSAVRDALEKGRVQMILCAEDVSEGTKEKVLLQALSIPYANLFTREEMGGMFGRELVGVIAIEDSGFAQAIGKETERLKSLININE